MMTEHISFLLGSGFSVPEKLPTVTDINKRLRQLKEDEFYLGLDQSAFFYNSEWRDPNGWMPSSAIDRLFAQEFTAFYCIEVLKGNIDDYNYEVFFDYISEFLRYQKHAVEIRNFCKSFRTKHIIDNILSSDDYNFVWRFSKILSQLIAGLLTVPRFYADTTYRNYPTYDPLVSFIRENLKTKIVNVHSLNHDMFFDMLGSKHAALWQHYCDGFIEYGSPYFGNVSIDHELDNGVVHKAYKVRLRYYKDDYSKNLRLFKLHGSIDNYILLKSDSLGENSYSIENAARVKADYAVEEFMEERFDEKLKKYIYDRPFSEKFPDFLTGTTEKIRSYNDPFYNNLLTHFKNNLLNSTHLFVIGYGFQDKGINEYLENHYLIYNKSMVVIDIKKPTSFIFEKYAAQISFIDKGAIGVSFKEYMELSK